MTVSGTRQQRGEVECKVEAKRVLEGGREIYS